MWWLSQQSIVSFTVFSERIFSGYLHTENDPYSLTTWEDYDYVQMMQ